MSSHKDATSSQLRNLVLKNALEGKDSQKDDSLMEIILFTALLIFLGNEAVKILLRKNFGMSRESWIRLILCVVCFAAIAGFSFYFYLSESQTAKDTGTPGSHLATGTIFSILTITLIIKAITDRDNSGIDSEGVSHVLGFLSKEMKPDAIRLVAEPVLILALGISFSLFNRIGGFATIYCALSVWLSALSEQIFPHHPMNSTVSRLNSTLKPDHSSFEINND